MTFDSNLPSTPRTISWTVAGGVRLAGASWGHQDGRVVLLLHGGGQTRHAWRGAGARLADLGYHAVALDVRGHGESDWAPDGDYTPATLVRDLVEVVEQSGFRNPVLVGASVGGGTALTAVGEGKIDAAALVLVDITPRVELDGAAKVLDFMRSHADGFANLDEAADAISSYQPHRKRRDSSDGLFKNVRLWPDGRYRWHWDPRFIDARLDFDERQRQQERCARAVRVPTLLIRGGLSDVVSRVAADEFLAMCPHAQLVDVAHAAHMVVGDRNDVFLDALVEFVARVVPVRS